MRIAAVSVGIVRTRRDANLSTIPAPDYSPGARLASVSAWFAVRVIARHHKQGTHPEITGTPAKAGKAGKGVGKQGREPGAGRQGRVLVAKRK